MRISFDRAKAIVAAATYETLLYHSEYESFGAEEIHKRVDQHFGAGFVRRMLTSLAGDGLVVIDQYDETAPKHFTLSDEGLSYVEKLKPLAVLLAEESSSEEIPSVAPASDRSVPLDHNRPEYGEISEAFDAAIKVAEQTKPNEVSGDEHASIMAGLRGARELWRSFQLTRMQIEIGLIMALEQAEEQLKVSFKMARGSLLVEGIKAFFKAMKESV